jgi:hypothetical protein
MRGMWLVAGSLGLVAVAYLADRWLQEILINVGIYGGSNGWRELGLAVSLLSRIILLAGLAAVFMALRARRVGWASGAIVGIGALAGLAPPVILGIHIALPEGLPFVILNNETAPVWSGSAAFLPWTAIGLLVIGLVAMVASRGTAFCTAVQAPALAIGAAMLFVATYPLDALFQVLAVDLASGLDAYPAFMLVGLAGRIAVMIAFAVLLPMVMGRSPSRLGGVAMLAVGLVGFVVLPLVGLLPPTLPPPGGESLATTLDPGTAGRWMAGATLVAGVVELLRPHDAASARADIDRDLARVSVA